ncbi:alpha beta hydrolase fold family [Apodospora peruviana]|uniref:Alpha beta hydrolase fold family n=1 Tax=Apodospora peruviana TaxID=516989 RepID=A0AAE0I404_9PEZI|nr:alpha beta hydrolase fold family [Apodospora peruviana]
MIPNTFPHYVFIRVCIWGLRAVAPASLVYCAVRLIGYSLVPPPLEILAFVEAAFYLCAGLPRQYVLDKSKPRSLQRTRQERRELFDRCFRNVPDLDTFLVTWFKDRPLDDLRAENVKDFLAWGFFYKTRGSPEDDDELDEYLHETERILGRKFPPGRGPHHPAQVSTDPLHMQHKPFFFYVFAVGSDDLMTYAALRWYGLDHCRLLLSRSLSVFPFRPHTILSRHTSPSSHLSYWYRPHTSTKRRPVLFLHGVGAGLRTYASFLGEFIRQDGATNRDDDGQTGIIAIEIMPISMRMTGGCLPRSEMLTELLRILHHHDWDDLKLAVVAHSYGTILATHLLQALEPERLGPMLLIDPVTISIHWGEVPYNFLYRKPRSASEWQLQYFASADMGVAHAITRRFDWSENVLWKDDMKRHQQGMTVVLSGRDIIIEPHAVKQYLLEDKELNFRFVDSRNYYRGGEDGGEDVFGGRGMGLLWYDHANHAEMFDTARDMKPLVDILIKYCSMVD